MQRATRVKALAGAVLLAALTALPSPSLAQATEFVGGGTIGAFRGCEAGGWLADDLEQVVAQLFPAGLSGNDANASGLSLMLPDGTIWIAYSRFATRYRAVDEYLQILDGDGGGATNPVAMRRLAGATTRINANTRQISFVADVRHFADVAGCEARVSLYLYRN